MGRGTQARQGAAQRDIGSERADHPDPRANKPGRRPKPRPSEPDAAEVHWDVLRHYFPRFVDWLKALRDPRKRPELCTYPVEYVLMTALLMFCGQCGSRRRLGRKLVGGRMGGNIWRLIGRAYSDVTLHTDTMNNVMSELDPQELEKLIAAVFTELRTRRVLDHFRFDGMLTVAVDATQVFSSKKPHCDHCTHQTSNGVTTFFHNVLAAKVVTAIGLVVPLAFEFIENPGKEYDKQDCEKKAWRRLAAKIRGLFPRLKINLVGDGLYAEEPTFNECEEAGWNFMITLTDKDLPTVNAQLPTNRDDWTGTRSRRVTGRNKPVNSKAVRRTVRWKTPVTYHGQIVHVIEMEETDKEGNRVYYNKWITNVKPNEQNALDLAQTGRLRWRIENEGTNTQKNGGYEMGHLYGTKERAWKNYYLVLQIGQLLNDLTRFGDYIQKITGDRRATFEAVYGTMRQFAEQLIAHLRDRLPVFREPGCGPAQQIRLARL